MPVKTKQSYEWASSFEDLEYNQKHVLNRSLVVDTKRGLYDKLRDQLNEIEVHYEGGVLGYIKRSRKLLEEAKKGTNPFSQYIPKQPTTVDLTPDSANYNEYESAGTRLLSHVAFVLVAGGMGERLGFSQTKVELPVDCVFQLSYLHYFCLMIKACGSTCQPYNPLPFVIMTSDDTHERVTNLLRKNNYFGLQPGQVHILKQLQVPALKNNDAQFSSKTNEDGRVVLELKPHGHGDIHALIHKAKLTEQWLKQDIKYVIFFQDTNALVSYAVAPLLGASFLHNFDMNSATVRRKPGEAMGAVCQLIKRESAKEEISDKSHQKSHNSGSMPNNMTINIEYNVLDSLLKENGIIETQQAVENGGYSLFPGNTNILCLNLNFYSRILNETKGVIAEFVNPKYTDATRSAFKSPARLECMMQDIPKAARADDRIGVTNLPRWLCFSTVKNNAVDAAAKAKARLPPESPFTGRESLFRQHFNVGQLKSNHGRV